jgi:hypothetical protein
MAAKRAVFAGFFGGPEVLGKVVCGMMEGKMNFGARSLSSQQLPGILLKIKQKDKEGRRLHRLEFMSRHRSQPRPGRTETGNSLVCAGETPIFVDDYKQVRG